VVGTTTPLSGAKSFGPSAVDDGQWCIFHNNPATTDMTVTFAQKVRRPGNTTQYLCISPMLRANLAGTQSYLLLPDFGGSNMLPFVQNGTFSVKGSIPFPNSVTFSDGDWCWIK